VRILLVNLPPDVRETMFPLELASAGAALKLSGHDISGFDLGLDRRASLASAAAACDVLVCMPDSDTWPLFSRLLAQLEPDARRLVVVGGTHATLFPDEVLRDEMVDLVIPGEPEEVIGRAVEAWHHRQPATVPGAVWQERWTGQGFVSAGDYLRIERLDEIAPPDRDVFPIDAYKGMATRRTHYTQIVAGRGTDRTRIFSPLASALPGGRKVRSPRKVVDEMADLVERFGIGEFHLEDDGLLEQPDYVADLCEEICRRVPQVVWQCPGNNHPDDVSGEMLARMAAAGCYRVCLALHDMDPAAMESLDWSWDVARLEPLCRRAQQEGVQLGGYFTFGLPGQSAEQMRAAAAWAADSGLTWAQFTPLRLMPGSELWQRRERLAARIPPQRTIRRAVRRAYWKFYLGKRRWRAVLGELNRRNAGQLLRRAYDKMVRGRPY